MINSDRVKRLCQCLSYGTVAMMLFIQGVSAQVKINKEGKLDSGSVTSTSSSCKEPIAQKFERPNFLIELKAGCVQWHKQQSELRAFVKGTVLNARGNRKDNFLGFTADSTNHKGAFFLTDGNFQRYELKSTSGLPVVQYKTAYGYPAKSGKHVQAGRSFRVLFVFNLGDAKPVPPFTIEFQLGDDADSPGALRPQNYDFEGLGLKVVK